MFRNRLLPITVAILFISLGSCVSTENTTKIPTENLTILSATYTPVIRGAGRSKGVKIQITALRSEGISVDSIHYEMLFKPAELVRNSEDTIWLEAFFYPNHKKEGSELETGFSSAECRLFYTSNKETKSLFLKNMELVSSPTQWK